MKKMMEMTVILSVVEVVVSVAGRSSSKIQAVVVSGALVVAMVVVMAVDVTLLQQEVVNI